MKKLIIIIPMIFMLLVPLGTALAVNIPDTPGTNIYESNNYPSHETKEKIIQFNREHNDQTEKTNQLLAGLAVGFIITISLSLIGKTVVENGTTQTECYTYNNGKIISKTVVENGTTQTEYYTYNNGKIIKAG